MYDVDLLRSSEFPHAGQLAYLNHAAISPLPVRTAAAVEACVADMRHNPTAFMHREGGPMFERFPRTVAAFINAPNPTDVCPISSTFSGLSLVAMALDWRPGDNIIFCDVEFPANAYPWLSLERQGVECRLVKPQGGTLTVEAVDAVVDAHTRLVAVSAFQFFNGARTDLQSLGTYCHDHSLLFVVDAIQAIGHMPIDVQAMHIDVLATGGQKSLMAMIGGGFLYVRQAVADSMTPAQISHNAVENWEHWLDYDLTLRPGAFRFMNGSPNLPGMVAIVSSLSLIDELGRPNIDAHTTRLMSHLIDELDARGFRVITSRDRHGPIVTFQYSASLEITDQFVARLVEEDVLVTRHLDAAGQPYVRLSVHCYNTHSDLERFLDGVAQNA